MYLNPRKLKTYLILSSCSFYVDNKKNLSIVFLLLHTGVVLRFVLSVMLTLKDQVNIV